MPPRVPLLRALFFILLSAAVVTGSAIGVWRYYRQNKWERQHSPAYSLTTIVQAPREALNPGYLEELFDLSVDQPTNCYAFDTEAARRKLAALPVVHEGSVSVKVLPPHTVYVKYLLRTPVAYLGNFSNTLLDAKGFSFPAEPFFTPKRLPEFYLDLKDEDGFTKAANIAERLGAQGVRVKRIDLSQMNAASCGTREIVVAVDYEGAEHLLRLDADGWEDGVRRYSLLKDILKGDVVVDLRIKRMAFLELRASTI